MPKFYFCVENSVFVIVVLVQWTSLMVISGTVFWRYISAQIFALFGMQ